MNIKVLGSGCNKCKALERVTRKALAELDLTADLDKVEDYSTILSYGVMSTPALVVNDEVVLSGRVPTVAQVRAILASHAA